MPAPVRSWIFTRPLPVTPKKFRWLALESGPTRFGASTRPPVSPNRHVRPRPTRKATPPVKRSHRISPVRGPQGASNSATPLHDLHPTHTRRSVNYRAAQRIPGPTTAAGADCPARLQENPSRDSGNTPDPSHQAEPTPSARLRPASPPPHDPAATTSRHTPRNRHGPHTPHSVTEGALSPLSLHPPRIPAPHVSCRPIRADRQKQAVRPGSRVRKQRGAPTDRTPKPPSRPRRCPHRSAPSTFTARDSHTSTPQRDATVRLPPTVTVPVADLVRVHDEGPLGGKRDHQATFAEFTRGSTGRQVSDAIFSGQITLSRQASSGRDLALGDPPGDVVSHLHVDVRDLVWIDG